MSRSFGVLSGGEGGGEVICTLRVEEKLRCLNVNMRDEKDYDHAHQGEKNKRSNELKNNTPEENRRTVSKVSFRQTIGCYAVGGRGGGSKCP